VEVAAAVQSVDFIFVHAKQTERAVIISFQRRRLDHQSRPACSLLGVKELVHSRLLALAQLVSMWVPYALMPWKRYLQARRPTVKVAVGAFKLVLRQLDHPKVNGTDRIVLDARAPDLNVGAWTDSTS
jgi:hypothetical protein